MKGLNAVSERWGRLAPRERVSVLLAGLAVAAALGWSLLLSPALQTLRTAPAQHDRFDAQLREMQAMQAQATALSKLPRPSRTQTLPALEAAVQQRLGAKARLVVAGEHVTVMLQGVSADALAQCLAQMRTEARAVPTEAKLERNSAGLFEGRLLLSLPQ